MKTKELIRLLKQIDPSGDTECCINNFDILSVVRNPADFGGCLEVLIRDTKINGHNVIGAKIFSAGTKVCFNTHSIQDAIMDDPNLPVDISQDVNGKYSRDLVKWRSKSRELISEIDEWYRRMMSGRELPLGD